MICSVSYTIFKCFTYHSVSFFISPLSESSCEAFSQYFKSLSLLIVESFSSYPLTPAKYLYRKGGPDEHNSASEGTPLVSPGFVSYRKTPGKYKHIFVSKIIFKNKQTNKQTNQPKNKNTTLLLVKYRYWL